MMTNGWEDAISLVVIAWFIFTIFAGFILETRYRRAFDDLRAERDALQASYEACVHKTSEEAHELIARESHRLAALVREFIDDPYAPKWQDEATVSAILQPKLKVF